MLAGCLFKKPTKLTELPEPLALPDGLKDAYNKLSVHCPLSLPAHVLVVEGLDGSGCHGHCARMGMSQGDEENKIPPFFRIEINKAEDDWMTETLVHEWAHGLQWQNWHDLCGNEARWHDAIWGIYYSLCYRVVFCNAEH